jgi:hypothetical protein
MDQIEEALAELRMQDKPRFSEVAIKYKVDRTRLSKRYHRIHQSREDGYENQRLLDAAQSQALIKLIRELTERGLPPTVAIVRNLAEEIAGRAPGKNWAS